MVREKLVLLSPLKGRGEFQLGDLCVITFIAAVDKPISSLVQRIRSWSCHFLLTSEQVLFGPDSKDTLRSALPDRAKAAAKHHHHYSERLMAHALDRPLLLELLESTESPLQTSLPVAPTMRFSEPTKEGCVRVTVPIDVLALVHWDMSVADVAVLLKDRICAQLQAVKDEIMWMVWVYRYSVAVIGCCVYKNGHCGTATAALVIFLSTL